MSRLKICRDDIYVGELVVPTKINRYVERNCYDESNLGKLYVEAYKLYRTMLFTPDVNNMSRDLLYATPPYPILNISDDEECLNSKIVVQEALNLGKLLKYLGFNEKLSLAQVWQVRQYLFYGNFAENNPQLWQGKNPEFQYSMMRMLDRLGNKSIWDVIKGFEDKVDTFKIDKKEGRVKKLRRY